MYRVIYAVYSKEEKEYRSLTEEDANNMFNVWAKQHSYVRLYKEEYESQEDYERRMPSSSHLVRKVGNL